MNQLAREKYCHGLEPRMVTEAPMNVILSPAIEERIEREVATGRYPDRNQLIEDALRDFLDRRQRDESRVQALRRIAQAVDDAGLYERVLLPDRE